MRAPDECAVCGAAIPRQAKACPECGADERTGWRGQSVYEGLDLPDDAWDEQGSHPSRSQPSRVNGLPWYWWLVGVLLLALLGFGFIGGH